MPLGSDRASLGGSSVLHKVIQEDIKKSIKKHKAQSFDIQYVISSSYSNDVPRVKRGGLSVLYRVTKNVYREILKIFLSKATGPRALIFCLQHHLVILYKGAPLWPLTCFSVSDQWPSSSGLVCFVLLVYFHICSIFLQAQSFKNGHFGLLFNNKIWLLVYWRVTPPSPLAYCVPLYFGIAYCVPLFFGLAYCVPFNNKNNHFGRFHLHKEVKITVCCMHMYCNS